MMNMTARKIPRASKGVRKIIEGGLTGLLFACALVSVFILLLVFLFLLGNSLPFLENNDIWKFLTGTVWRPFAEFPSYGIMPLFIGTLMITLVAAVIAIPIGLGCTIYLSEIASPGVKKILKPVIEVLAGVPSVIYGLFAALVLSDWVMTMFSPDTRLNALNGALILDDTDIGIDRRRGVELGAAKSARGIVRARRHQVGDP
jgi:ABC-type phosphate transport system permease subunit